VDGLRKLIVISLLAFAFLSGSPVKSEMKPSFNLDTQYYTNWEFLANGRIFTRMKHSHISGGKLYPVYVDEKGIEAYNFGMIVLELRPIQSYDTAIAWSVFADDFTTYEDLGITLLEFEDPWRAEQAYQSLFFSEDPNILYMEMALIEMESK
jgi:hypothetical protein